MGGDPLCAYCDAEDPGTRDHVPPANLFAKPRPDNLITVPACRDCHEGTSEDDEYFRNMLAMRAEVGDHPEAQEILPAVLRSYKKPEKQGFAESLRESIAIRDAVSEAGLYLGKVATYSVDFDRLCNVVSRTVRGLYYHEFEEPLSSERSVECYALEGIEDLDVEAAESFLDMLKKVVAAEPTVIGDQVFRYQYQVATDRAETSLWFLAFYQRVTFLVLTL